MKLFFLLFFALSILFARDVVESKGECSINWTQGFIECQGESAEGQSRYGAKISAKVIAQRNLLEVIKGVHIDSETTIEDGMFSSEIIKSRVSGTIRGAQVVANKYDTKQKYAVAILKLMMGKDLLSALMSDPTQLSFNEKVMQLWNSFHIVPEANAATYGYKDKATIQKVLEDLRVNGDVQGSAYLHKVLQNIDEQEYSGVLIDVSEIKNFKKAMIVKLVDEKGHELYPAGLVGTEVLIKQNTSVGYIYGLEDAKKNRRVYHTPLEMKATSIYKKRYSNIVLTKEQVKQLKSINTDILKNAKIILVLGD